MDRCVYYREVILSFGGLPLHKLLYTEVSFIGCSTIYDAVTNVLLK